MALQAGQMLGPYRIVQQIGQGGMATVYQAHHPKLDRYVAIKVIHPMFQNDDDFLARFEREAQIVARLDHPNIVPIYDYHEQDGQPYLVMKYVEGQTLKRRLSAREMSYGEALEVLAPLANALTYAHDRGILHRDIKPSNIMLGSDGTVYLMDFGLARIAQAGESTLSHEMLLGTPQYLSPEQARGEKILTSQADIYALGVVLYEILVGRVPFDAATPLAIVHNHVYDPLPLPSSLNPNITPAVEAVLLKALAKDPAERYTSATALVEAFRAAVNAPAEQPVAPNQAVSEPAPRKAKPAAAIFPSLPSAPAAPQLPTPPLPPSAPKIELRKTNNQIEAKIDLGDLSKLGKDFEQWGEKFSKVIEQKAEQIEAWVEKMEEEEVKKGRRSGKKSSKSAKRVSVPQTPSTLEERIIRNVEDRYERRKKLRDSFAKFISFNLILWGLWVLTGGLSALNDGLPWPVYFSFFASIGMVSRFVQYRLNGTADREKIEADIQRELALERERAAPLTHLEKPKNDLRFRLTDDGEIEEVADDNADEELLSKRKRG